MTGRGRILSGTRTRGARLTREETDELVERATGEPLTAAYFIDYAREKFGRLYGV
jgi:Zn-dependent M32 family carboxypeptidase